MNRLNMQIKLLIIFISVLGLSLSQNLNSEYGKSQLYRIDSTDFDWSNMYPLTVGDYWVYECYNPRFLIGLRTKKVIKDTLINNVVFKKIRQKSEYDGSIFFVYERVDTSSYIYKRIYNHQKRWLKLNVAENDTFKSDIPTNDCGYDNNICHWFIEDVWNDENGRNIVYYWDYLTATRYRLIENIGIKSGFYEGGGYNNLKGCYINGVLFGDTTTRSNGIEGNKNIRFPDLSISVYPNPFNPSTNISFSLEKQSKVDIRIYNLQGNEVWNWGNNLEYGSGYHSILWNAVDQSGNSLSSGVYFIKLMAGDRIATQKVIFMK